MLKMIFKKMILPLKQDDFQLQMSLKKSLQTGVDLVGCNLTHALCLKYLAKMS